MMKMKVPSKGIEPSDLQFRKLLLYPLSYEGTCKILPNEGRLVKRVRILI